MDPIKPSFDKLLARKIATLPVFIRPHLAEILTDMLSWVEHVEQRFQLLEGQVRAINKMPSPDALRALTAQEPAPAAAARIQAQIDRACGPCED